VITAGGPLRATHQPRTFYGAGLPGVDTDKLVGRLVVIEGADGSGRSTQIGMLRDWLEGEGFPAVDVGLARSDLVSKELEAAKEGNVLGRTTMSLFYATDFADQLENRIIPALMAGFIVLADRYVYTLMARDLARGADRSWVENLYRFALVPDAVFYLRVSPRQLVERTFRKNSELDFWESGMDIGLSRDRFDSFVRYQTLIQKQFTVMHERYGFQVVNANRTPAWSNRQLRAGIEQMLAASTYEGRVPRAEHYRPLRRS
jgi:dTMP kinase